MNIPFLYEVLPEYLEAHVAILFLRLTALVHMTQVWLHATHGFINKLPDVHHELLNVLSFILQKLRTRCISNTL